jgi:curli production assembly/transport component CsgF
MRSRLFKRSVLASLLALLALLAVPAAAGQLVYQPVNPGFGGNPFNADYLLGTAQAQNDYEDKGSGSSDPIDDFARTLESRLLSRLSSDIADAIYGEDAADSGRFQIDDTVIEFERIGEQVKIEIADGRGETTTIELPVPQF